jgi:hypothetical protein
MKKRLSLVLGSLLLVGIAAVALRTTKATSPSPQGGALEAAPSSLADDLSLREMAQQSEIIVTGTCTGTSSQWVGRDLVTLAEVAVGDAIKGAPAPTVTVVLPGGVDTNRKFPVAMTYPGAPTIQPEENVFLFLTGEEQVAGGYSVMGFAQGKYSVVEDEQGRKLVSRDLTKVKVRSGPGVVRGTAQREPLSEFAEKVRGYLQ